MPYEFGNIGLMPYPFTDQSVARKRPATVVSNRAYKAARLDLVVMAVTSQLRPTAALGKIFVSQCQQAGLLKPSAVKPVLATVKQRLVIRQLGALLLVDQVALRRAISETIG